MNPTKKVYLDNAASTFLDAEVFESMRPYFLEFNGNPSSTHAFGRTLRTGVEQARRTIAQILGANPGEIYFTSGGTEADNTAIMGAVAGLGIKHIVSTKLEHHAVTHAIEALEIAGKCSVTWLPVSEKGHIDLRDLQIALEKHPQSLVTLMHANNEIGTLYDIAKIGEICKSYKALFHSDTVQTMGNYSFELSQLPVDMLSASAHKFYGPKGTGFLYVKKGVKIGSLLQGGGQERNLRAGTENVPAIVGMAHALEKCQHTLTEKTAHLQGLKRYFIEALQKSIPGVTFNGDIDPDRSLPTVVNACFPGDEDSLLTFSLDIAGIAASGGSACTSGASTGSHVLRALERNARDISNSVRFSFGKQNTYEELDYVVEKLKEILRIPVY